MSYKSRLPEIAAEIALRMDVAARTVAEHVEVAAKERVPVDTGRLRDAIHTERTGLGEYAVIAGDNEAFYGHIVEHGGVHTPPHPFLVPAAEANLAAVATIGREILRSLQ